MYAIFKKEINSFFSSPIGYLVISIFLIANGLFIWVFKGEFNILDYGFADLSGYYFIAPWIFIFLIPAITMKSFSEEKKQGTLEILLTTPINKLQLVLGKFFGAFALITIALLPTLLYVYTVYQLGNPVGNIDLGSTFGAYAGLLGIAMIYCSIGIFSSAISNNQIVAFILGVLICFIIYYGFDAISENTGISIEKMGVKNHFSTISKGIIDTRDIIYFFSVTALFLFFTSLTLTKK
jgi:ABC-2 type transport system permease protein